jgi:hypothetical protein
MLGLMGLADSGIAAFPPFGPVPPPIISGSRLSTLSYETTFQLGALAQFEAVFSNASNNTYADPVQVVFLIVDPLGHVRDLSTIVTHDSVGHYHCQFMLNIVGTWTYKWRGIGTVAVSSPDTSVIVVASKLIP